MKGLVGLLGVLLTLALVGVLAKRQLAPPVAAPQAHSAKPAGAADAADGGLPSLPTGTPQQQVDQVKKDLDKLMATPPVPKDL